MRSMSQKEAEEYILRQINKKRDEEAKKRTEEIIGQWHEEHTGREIRRLEYWRKKKLEEILRRMEEKNKGG